jgi:Transposase DDE domain group 1
MGPIKTDCIPEQFKFKPVLSCPVVVNFNSEAVTSDARLTLIAELDRKRKITSRLAQCFKDYRDVNRIDYSVENLIAQRIYGFNILFITVKINSYLNIFAVNRVWKKILKTILFSEPHIPKTKAN